jgi:hypothetical protein
MNLRTDLFHYKIRKKENMEQKRSLFGPLLLVAAGILWLLIQAGTIPSTNLWALMYIWPFLLIVGGLGMLLRAYWAYTSIVLDVILIGGIVLAILYAPQFGWSNPSISMFIQSAEPFFGPSERGSGEVILETRDVSDFRAIEVGYPAQVSVKQGNTESVKIEAEDNLLPGLKTEVTNGTLRIFYKSEKNKRVNPTQIVQITIVVKDLKEVKFSSAGDLTIDNLATDHLEVSLSGTGNVNLKDIQAKTLRVSLSGAGSMTASGTADALDVTISGFGNFTGTELRNQGARINISGAGSTTVWVYKELTADISGAGSVNYYGTASVTQYISGVGNVKHLGNK